MHTRNSTVIVHFLPRISMISTVTNKPGIDPHNHMHQTILFVTRYLVEQVYLSNSSRKKHVTAIPGNSAADVHTILMQSSGVSSFSSQVKFDTTLIPIKVIITLKSYVETIHSTYHNEDHIAEMMQSKELYHSTTRRT